MLDVSINNENFRIPAGRPAEFILILKNKGNKKESAKIEIVPEFTVKDGELEWKMDITGLTKEGESILISPNEAKPIQYSVDVSKGKLKEIFFEIYPPKAAEIGDSGQFKIIVETDVGWEKTVKIDVDSAIVAIKTQIGQEIKVARELGLKAKMKGWKDIFAVMAPYNLRGYVLVETSRPDVVLSVIKGIRGAKGVVKGEMNIDDVKGYLTPTPTVSTISKGDIVELVEGPFKGEHARVMDIDESKNEITVELFEAMVPIPITVKAEAVRLIERGDKDGSSS
ncbi:MAG: transcription elongation factor Spt5 [Euryarchaeota archaeon]|nr:transcription elongation factor Spt5 [Euryarchaeota archaeon]